MRILQLYIAGQRVDLFKDESVELTQTIKNVKDIAKIFTEFSKTFAVPASSVNNKIFKHYYNAGILNSFDARIKVDASLELNNLPFKEGKISLQGVDLKNNVAHTYRITFFGKTANLKDILGDSLLSTLPFSQNQIYDYADVTTRMQSESNDIIVPLITHTNRLIYNGGLSSTFNEEDQINNIFAVTGLGSNTRNGVLWNQFKYAIRLQAIIDAIQTEYPSIQFSDDFFNDNTNEQFYNLFMWLHRKSGSVEGVEQVETIFTRVTDMVVNPINPPTGSPPQISSVSNGVISVNAAGVDLNLLNVNFEPTDPTAFYSAKLIRDGSNVVAEFNNLQATQFLQITTTTGFNNNSTYTIEIGGVIAFAANKIDVQINYRVDSDDPPYFEIENDRYHNNAFLQSNQKLEFNISQQIPKMKIIDFLSGLFKMFNLTAYVNDVGIIVVTTLDSYYSDSVNIYTIDEYLDTTTSISDVALPFNQINFTYKGLGSFLAKQFEQLTNSGWGSLAYRLDGNIFDALSEAYKVELPFEHMLYERLYDISNSPPTSTAVQYGYSVNESQQPYIGSPLLFYPILISNGTTIRIRNNVSTAISDITNYFIPSNSLALDCATSKVNINFQPEINEYTANEPGDPDCFTDTLFETKYKTYIQDVFNIRRRLVKVTANLPMKVYYNLKLNDLIEINQETYKINSLTTNLTTGKTKFELLNTLL